MNQENITVSLTATEHELLNEALLQLQNCFDVVVSHTELYKDQKMQKQIYDINNLRTKMLELWVNRFDDEEVEV